MSAIFSPWVICSEGTRREGDALTRGPGDVTGDRRWPLRGCVIGKTFSTGSRCSWRLRWRPGLYGSAPDGTYRF